MHKQFTCTNGHRWQVTVDGNLPVAVQCISCPECGSPAETLSPDGSGAPMVSPETARAGLSETAVPENASSRPVVCSCPSCGKVLKVKASLAGKRVKCPQCKQSFAVPSAAARRSPILTANMPTLPPHLAGAGAPLSPETLLARAKAAGTQEQRDLYDFLAPPQQADELGRLGPYRVLKVLGAGGMGVVFQAEDPTLMRKVALKAMLPALAVSESARQRFLREAQTAAAIEHDHIVAIFQVAEDRGVPFIAMPLLKGESLEDRLDRKQVLPIHEVLRIGRETAKGLAAAHAQGLIHRDIKPANIWLETQPESGTSATGGRVKILDFGLARAAEDNAHLTQLGAILGTPAYMAPEQAGRQKVDARCDLFSLGCVLYRLCTGDLPFKGSDTVSMLLAVASEQPKPPREINPEVPEALSKLVMQLLAKKPGDRLPSAQAVVERLAAIESELLRARRRPGPPARRRWPAVVAGTAALLVVLLAVTVIRIATNQGELEIETADDNVQVVVLKGGEEIEIIDLKSKQKITLRSGQYELKLAGNGKDLVLSTDRFQLKRGETVIAKITRRLAKEPVAEVKPEKNGGGQVKLPAKEKLAFVPPPPLATSAFDKLRAADIPEQQLTAAGEGDPKLAPTGLVAVLGDGRLRHWNGVFCLAFTPDGKSLVSGGGDSTVRVWDMDTGRERQVFTSLRNGLGWIGYMISLVVTPDGKDLITGSTLKSPVRVWNLSTGLEQSVLPCNGTLVALSSNGKVFACASPNVAGVPFAGNALIEVGNLSDLRAGKLPRSLRGHDNPVQAIALNAEGTLLASASEDATVRIWDTATGKERHTLQEHQGTVAAVAFSPDGKWLASGGKDRTIRLWNAETGDLKRVIRGRHGAVSSLAFSPDGKKLAVAEAALRLWDLVDEDKEPLTFDRPASVVAYSRDGKYLASGSGERVTVWDAATGKRVLPISGHVDAISCFAVSHDGKALATGRRFDGTIGLWDVATLKEQKTLGVAKAGTTSTRMACVIFSPDGKLLAGLGRDGMLRAWDAATGNPRFTLEAAGNGNVAFSPDGKLLAYRGRDALVRLRDIASGTEKSIRRAFLSNASPEVAFSPDGKLLAASGKLWDVATGEERGTFKGAEPNSWQGTPVFSPDGKLLVCGYYEAKIWDVATGEERRDLPSMAAAFSPDSGTLASLVTAGTAGSCSVLLWDPDGPGTRWRKHFRIGPATGVSRQIAFTPEGRHLVVRNDNGTIYILRLASPPAQAGK